MRTMYPGKVNSPVTVLVKLLRASDEEIVVLDASVLPDGPNLCTIGTDEDAETIKYTAKIGNTLSCAGGRGFQGAIKEWEAGTAVGRMITEYDVTSLQENVEDLDVISHDRQHGLGSTDDHTGITGTENNFMGINGSGLPKDSGSKAADFATAGHNHAGTYEPVITPKGSAYNKNFGAGSEEVARGNHNHDGVYNNYAHPTGGSGSQTGLTGSTVINGITVNAEGHVTGSTTRNMTASDVGASASDHNHAGTYEPADAAIQTHITTAHAPSDAQKNVQSDWNQADTGADDHIKNKPTSMAPTSHTHGNLTNDGKIGADANKPVITGADGVVQAGAFGTTANTFAEGDHGHADLHTHSNKTTLDAVPDHTSASTDHVLKKTTEGLAWGSVATGTHDRLHNLNSTDDHTGVLGDENNFMALDENGLPKDSGSKAGDFAASGHNHTGTYEPADAAIQSHISSAHAPADANNYVHPSGDGNSHVPTTGTENDGKILKAGATAGSIAWGTLSHSDVGAAASDHNHSGTYATATHTHGNLTSDGKVGTTENLPLITGTDGAVQAGAFGAGATDFAAGNHTHTGYEATLNANQKVAIHISEDEPVSWADGELWFQIPEGE